MFPTRATIGAALLLTSGILHGAQPIPLEAFFSQPNFISPRLSAAGDKLAFIAQVGEHQVLGVRGFGDPQPALIGRNSELQYRWYKLDWANPKRLLVSAQTLYRSPEMLSKVRYRATRLMGIDIDGGNDVILGRKWERASYSAVQYQDRLVHLLPEDPQYVLIQIRQVDDRFAAVYRMNVRSGTIRQIESAPGDVTDYWADGDGAVRAGRGLFDGFVARSRPDAAFETFTIKRTDNQEEHLSFAGFSAQPEIVWVFDEVDDFVVVRRFDLNTRTFAGAAHGARGYDVRDVFTDPLTNVVKGYTYFDDELQYAFIDAAWETAYAPVLDALPGSVVDLVSVSANGLKAVLENSGDTMPPHYYLLDRSGDKPALSPLGRSYPDLSDYPLTPTRALRYTASDGLEIAAYLTTPAPDGGKPMPTIVLPHGGPVIRDYLGWDAEVQFLASRGYAVFRPNFRGSSGYGRSFREAAFKEWGGRMQQDITDGVRWLIRQGLADPDRIAIFGTSYGGYAALMGAARDPDLYRAAISYAGVTYLPWLENEFADGLGNYRRVFREMAPETVIENSPAERFADIKVPILIGHGDLDSRVNVRHSRRMAKGLENAGKSVQYLEFEDEIHGFLLEDNRLRWYRAVEAFLAEHLGT